MSREPDILVTEVGLRDGLQSASAIMPTADKCVWIDAEHAAGVPSMEVTSFVPPSLLPQFADAREVVAHALRRPGLEVCALVPNLKGAQAAFAAGVHRVNAVIAVSDGHNRSNLNRSTDVALAEIGRIAELWTGADPATRPRLTVGLATAFGCTIGGDVPEADVRALAGKIRAFGVEAFLVADTVGYGNPAAVDRLFRALREDLGDDVAIGAHFHDTRGTGLANVVAALEAGIRHFDAALGGLGGCPFAPGATGNIVTEDLVYMLEAMGLSTGVDLDRLLTVRESVVAAIPDEKFVGTLARAGIPKNYRPQRGRTQVTETA